MPSNNAVTPNVSSAFGTGDGVVADVGGAFVQATLNNNFRDVVNAINSSRVIGVFRDNTGGLYMDIQLTVDAGSGEAPETAGVHVYRITALQRIS